ncbi:MAG: glycosyltransferase [Lachnospiraceae bacterium]|nr:glycosyltransferase [Lachnospiraceae bacterium]
MIISVVLPAYQEADNLRKILPAISSVLHSIGKESEILVVDTIEPMDETKEVCEENNAMYINRQGGNLYGDAIRTGLQAAKGKYIVVMDADGSHNPADIERFYQEMQKADYDVVIGSRYCKGGYTDNNFVLRAMSLLLNVTYRILFGLKIKDVSDSFRMYLADKIKALEFECNNFDIVEEILIKLDVKYDSLAVKEVPISFNKREYGESKRDLIKFIKSYIKTIAHLLKIRRQAIKGK